MELRALRVSTGVFLSIFFIFGLLGVTRADVLPDAQPNVLSKVLEVQEPLETDLVIDLDEFRGQTFLSTMLYESKGEIAESGIVDQMDHDYEKTYKFPGWEQVEHGLTHFDRKNVSRVKRAFKNSSRRFSKSKLKAFVDKVEGTEYKIDNLWKLLSDNGVKGKLTSMWWRSG